MANLFRCTGVGSGEDLQCIERPYDSTATYNTDDTVMYGGELYICLEDGVTGDWDSSKWSRTYLDALGEMNSNLTNNFKLLASDRKVVSSDGSISFNTTSWTADKKRSILLLAYSQFYNGGASQDIHVYKNGAELTNYSFVFNGAHNTDGGTFLIDVEKDDVISFLISGSSSDSKYAFWAIYGLE